jgi:alkylhydroperoxidase family enzyme
MTEKSSPLGARLTDLGSTRYRDLVAGATHGVLDSDAETSKELRWALFHHRIEGIPAELHAFITKVRDHAYKVTDEDVEALKHAGYSEDKIFEITAATTLGAAITRLERGLIALHESES